MIVSAGLVPGVDHVRMGAVRQGHEREERPIIVDRWIFAIFNSVPRLDLWTP